jgi:hypothetical protein
MKIRIKSVEGIHVDLNDWDFEPEFATMRHRPSGAIFHIDYDPRHPSEEGRSRNICHAWTESENVTLGRMALATWDYLWRTATVTVAKTPRPKAKVH